jgi:hypothetical protein
VIIKAAADVLSFLEPLLIIRRSGINPCLIFENRPIYNH